MCKRIWHCQEPAPVVTTLLMKSWKCFLIEKSRIILISDNYAFIHTSDFHLQYVFQCNTLGASLLDFISLLLSCVSLHGFWVCSPSLSLIKPHSAFSYPVCWWKYQPIVTSPRWTFVEPHLRHFWSDIHLSYSLLSVHLFCDCSIQTILLHCQHLHLDPNA